MYYKSFSEVNKSTGDFRRVRMMALYALAFATLDRHATSEYWTSVSAFVRCRKDALHCSSLSSTAIRRREFSFLSPNVSVS